jgi:hypothetical protein
MGLLDNTTPQEYYDGNDFGNYQFVSLTDIINQFMLVYVGEDKIIPKAKRLDVAFHAQRALAELSFDTFKSHKAMEITVPETLQMILPQDYVNYTKISWVDSAGIKHLLYPMSKTSNPPSNPLQDSVGDFTLQAVGALVAASNFIALDAEYKDILIGMTITGAFIPTGTVVVGTSNATGITTIQVTAGAIITTNPGTTLTFTNTDGSLILPQKSSHIVENLTWDDSVTPFTITALTTASIADIEVGMLVYHDFFPAGTVVTNVFGTTIVVSNPHNANGTSVVAATAIAGGDEILFVSPDKIDTDTWANYKSGTLSEDNNNYYNDNYIDDIHWRRNGSRYGLDPQYAQANGSFYIDDSSGKIHFSSNISGKTVVLDYISDSLGTDGEMQVHKFAEEAMYRWMSHAIIAGKANVPEYLVMRLKKEKLAAIRTAKLRLSNLKIEELTQILRGQSKWIKH